MLDNSNVRVAAGVTLHESAHDRMLLSAGSGSKDPRDALPRSHLPADQSKQSASLKLAPAPKGSGAFHLGHAMDRLPHDRFGVGAPAGKQALATDKTQSGAFRG